MISYDFHISFYFHISGNKHPLASYFSIPRVPGFWLIVILCFLFYVVGGEIARFIETLALTRWYRRDDTRRVSFVVMLEWNMERLGVSDWRRLHECSHFGKVCIDTFAWSFCCCLQGPITFTVRLVFWWSIYHAHPCTARFVSMARNSVWLSVSSETCDIFFALWRRKTMKFRQWMGRLVSAKSYGPGVLEFEGGCSEELLDKEL